jgi:uncharacterized protein
MRAFNNPKIRGTSRRPPILAKLEKGGYLSCRARTVNHKQRKYYRITTEGSDLLERMREQQDRRALRGGRRTTMSFVVICLSALLVSALTLFSGFGLGTLLLPAFALFFPVEVAVAATAVVHGANNIFKISLVGKHADKALVVRFGLPAIIAAFAGAAALGYVAHFDEIARYSIGAKTAVITPIKLSMGLLMLVFALFELLPRLREIKFDRKYLLVGGILSGFFGGFSGHQGALRSAFLAKVGISTQAFVGTNAAIGFMVDTARITTYGALFMLAGAASPIGSDQWLLILAGVLAAFAGVVIGRRFLHKVTMHTVQTITGIMLLGIAATLMLGII